MTIALSLLFTAVLIALVLVAGMRPNRSRHTSFERKRRRSAGADTAVDELRERRAADVTTISRIVLMLLFTLFVVTSGSLFGLVAGTIVSLAVAVLYGVAARMVPAQRFAQRLYDEHELQILDFIDQHKKWFTWLRHEAAPTRHVSFESKEELIHMVAHDRTLLSEEQKKLLEGSLRFDTIKVIDIMTPKEAMFTVKKTEILGPLVLDDLYKSGHDSFPVTASSDDQQVVGILRLRDVQTLDTSRKHTAKVETAMDPDVRFIRPDQTASEALSVLIESQHHLLLVVNESKELVGLLSLNDIIKTLFGKS